MEARRDLLLEIGTEELPPRSLDDLSEHLARFLVAGLTEARLDPQSHERFASPRRLAVRVRGLREVQPDARQLRRGPALSAAFDTGGNPSKAAQGFARACGVEVADLEKLETEQGAWLCHHAVQNGRPARLLLADIVSGALRQLPIPRPMRWGALEEEFVRPVHWVVLLLGSDVVDTELLGVRCGRISRGHRFLHPAPVVLESPEEYPQALAEAKVIADFAVRRDAVQSRVDAAAQARGGQALMGEGLLDEVTALVEYPVALVGEFDARFLTLPREVLIATMQSHQKYFPLQGAGGDLLPAFVLVSNVDSPRPEAVRAGNEKVIRPRLEDASFFYAQDRERPLHARREDLGSVIFQTKLGSLAEKSARVARLATHIAAQLGADEALAQRAAELSKCDLLTEMVGEFPELQGTMGRYYALADGEPGEVAAALDEQYLPRRAGDVLPRSPIGQTLSLADKLDTVVGIFSLGQRPSGDKDPFALRRLALGVLRNLIEGRLDLDLYELVAYNAEGLPPGLRAPTLADDVFEFMLDRLRAYYLEQGVATEIFEAVRARRPTRPYDFQLRVDAVTAFTRLPEAHSLSAANKRIRNILRQAEYSNGTDVNARLLQDAAERRLYDELTALNTLVTPLFQGQRYTQALSALAGLRAPVDEFFDRVMVMAEDQALKANRLALLGALQQLFLEIADISLLPSQ